MQRARDGRECACAALGAAFIGRRDLGEHAVDRVEAACDEVLDAHGIRAAQIRFSGRSDVRAGSKRNRRRQRWWRRRNEGAVSFDAWSLARYPTPFNDAALEGPARDTDHRGNVGYRRRCQFVQAFAVGDALGRDFDFASRHLRPSPNKKRAGKTGALKTLFSRKALSSAPHHTKNAR